MTAFHAYDIRGIVGKALTKEVVYDIGRALGSEAKENDCKTLIIARDGRNSSPSLGESLAQSILSTGRDVIDLGMVPTPVLYFVTHHHQGRTGVMITGSHNPADYNGLKMVVDGETLADEKIQKLKQRIDNRLFATGNKGKLESNTSYVNEYIGIIANDVNLNRPMKIVVDCGNGVAGELGPTLLRALGCEVSELYGDMDGGGFLSTVPDTLPGSDEYLIGRELSVDSSLFFDGSMDDIRIYDRALTSAEIQILYREGDWP